MAGPLKETESPPGPPRPPASLSLPGLASSLHPMPPPQRTHSAVWLSHLPPDLAAAVNLRAVRSTPTSLTQTHRSQPVTCSPPMETFRNCSKILMTLGRYEPLSTAPGMKYMLNKWQLLFNLVSLMWVKQYQLHLRKKWTKRPLRRRLCPHFTDVSERSAGDEVGSQA